MTLDTRPHNYVIDGHGNVVAEWPVGENAPEPFSTPKPTVLPI